MSNWASPTGSTTILRLHGVITSAVQTVLTWGSRAGPWSKDRAARVDWSIGPAMEVSMVDFIVMADESHGSVFRPWRRRHWASAANIGTQEAWSYQQSVLICLAFRRRSFQHGTAQAIFCVSLVAASPDVNLRKVLLEMAKWLLRHGCVPCTFGYLNVKSSADGRIGSFQIHWWPFQWSASKPYVKISTNWWNIPSIAMIMAWFALEIWSVTQIDRGKINGDEIMNNEKAVLLLSPPTSILMPDLIHSVIWLCTICTLIGLASLLA